MVQADALGIPVAQVLRVQSKEIRTKRRQRAEEQAQKVAVKILIPLVFCILPCLFIAVLGPAAIGIMRSVLGHSRVIQRARSGPRARVFCVAAVLGLSLALSDPVALQGTVLLAAIAAHGDCGRPLQPPPRPLDPCRPRRGSPRWSSDGATPRAFCFSRTSLFRPDRGHHARLWPVLATSMSWVLGPGLSRARLRAVGDQSDRSRRSSVHGY